MGNTDSSILFNAYKYIFASGWTGAVDAADDGGLPDLPELQTAIRNKDVKYPLY